MDSIGSAVGASSSLIARRSSFKASLDWPEGRCPLNCHADDVARRIKSTRSPIS